MVAALEPLGLVQPVACTSSYSSGMHLYLPLGQEHKTWAIALAVSTLLEQAGFKLAPGQLEVFPNCKPYSATGEHSLYNGHRLPMQAGSYLLNDDLQMIWGDAHTFVQHWQFAQQRNRFDAKAMERVIKAARRRQFRITNKADKFLNDLNAEIEQGWTGPGQTNRLLGRIAMRSYIFGHVLYADSPLQGKALVQDIINIAQSLPGYEEWCRHQHELEQRAQGWASAIEQSHYFPYGTGKPQTEPIPDTNPEPTWNQHQQTQARDRIRLAVAQLLEKETLPSGITERFDALVDCGISGSTLYRHRDLWHPRHLQSATFDHDRGSCWGDCHEGESPQAKHTNLLQGNGCNPLSDGGLSDLTGQDPLAIGCNPLADEELSACEPRTMTQEEGIAHIKQVLAQVKARSQAEKERKRRYLRNDRFPFLN